MYNTLLYEVPNITQETPIICNECKNDDDDCNDDDDDDDGDDGDDDDDDIR